MNPSEDIQNRNLSTPCENSDLPLQKMTFQKPKIIQLSCKIDTQGGIGGPIESDNTGMFFS